MTYLNTLAKLAQAAQVGGRYRRYDTLEDMYDVLSPERILAMLAVIEAAKATAASLYIIGKRARADPGVIACAMNLDAVLAKLED
jgi:hypothetical protein